MLSRLGLRFSGLLIFLCVWHFVSSTGWVKPIFLPSPIATLQAIAGFAEKGWLTIALSNSLWRIYKALFLVSLIGIPVGILLGVNERLRTATSFIVDGAKTIPISGLLGLIVLWFGVEDNAKVAFLFLGSFVYLVALVRNAVSSIDPIWVKTAQSCGASPYQITSLVLIPAAMPGIWEAICICHGIMWTYVVLAEYINSSESELGLGFLIYISTRTQQTAGVFASIFLIAALASLTDFAFLMIGKSLLFSWKKDVYDATNRF
jgi:NitT/TauT family transport system permease protein